MSIYIVLIFFSVMTHFGKEVGVFSESTTFGEDITQYVKKKEIYI